MITKVRRPRRSPIPQRPLPQSGGGPHPNRCTPVPESGGGPGLPKAAESKPESTGGLGVAIAADNPAPKQWRPRCPQKVVPGRKAAETGCPQSTRGPCPKAAETTAFPKGRRPQVPKAVEAPVSRKRWGPRPQSGGGPNVSKVRVINRHTKTFTIQKRWAHRRCTPSYVGCLLSLPEMHAICILTQCAPCAPILPVCRVCVRMCRKCLVFHINAHTCGTIPAIGGR